MFEWDSHKVQSKRLSDLTIHKLSMIKEVQFVIHAVASMRTTYVGMFPTFVAMDVKINSFLPVIMCVCLHVLSLHGQVVHEPPRLTQVLERYSARYDEDMPYQGWSIMVILDTDRRAVDRFQQTFKARHPEFNPYLEWRYEQPYYKLILGAFEDQHQANIMIARLSKTYPGLITVRNVFPRRQLIDFRRVAG